jgi:DNA-binding GntR family transcriptional regulator
MKAAMPRPRSPESASPRARSLPDQIAEWLSDEILREELAPGERITETAVAERFGVSRGPVRDAFKLLEQDGLVTILPRRGVVVTRLDEHDIAEIFQIRAVLGGLAAKLMVENAPRDLIEEYVRRARNIRRMVGDRDRFFKESSVLADLIAPYGGNRRLSALITSLYKPVQRSRYHAFGDRRTRELTADLFQEVADAFSSGDPEQVRWVVERATQRLKDVIIASLATTKTE